MLRHRVKRPAFRRSHNVRIAFALRLIAWPMPCQLQRGRFVLWLAQPTSSPGSSRFPIWWRGCLRSWPFFRCSFVVRQVRVRAAPMLSRGTVEPRSKLNPVLGSAFMRYLLLYEPKKKKKNHTYTHTKNACESVQMRARAGVPFRWWSLIIESAILTAKLRRRVEV